MDDPLSDEQRQSADVRLALTVGGRSYELAQIGPDSVILRESVDLPPSPAEIVMLVDGRERRWSVFLPWGAMQGDSSVLTEGV